MQFDEGFLRSLLDHLTQGIYMVDRDRKIRYWNEGAARICGHREADVLGRYCADGLLEHVDEEGKALCGEGCPLAATLADGVSREASAYLRHKDGHRRPVLVRCSAIRAEGGAVSGAVQVFSETMPESPSEGRREEMALLALLDPLTGAGSRRHAETTIRKSLAERDRSGLSSALLLVGIDRLLAIRAGHGSKAADAALCVVSRTLQGALRAEDFLARWADDAFLVVLGSANPAQLAGTSRRLRSLVTRSTVPGVPAVSLTVSIGATAVQAGDSADTLLRRVEKLARKAREGGGGRIESDGEESGRKRDEPEEAGPPIAEPDAAPRSEKELERQLRIRTIPLYVPPEIRATVRASRRSP